MITPPLSPEDPRLTAFALGELEGAERAEIERAVQADASLQAAVAELRLLENELRGSLAAEPAEVPVPARSDRYAKKFVRFPYYLVTGLAAACFAVMVALQRKPSPEPTVRQFELNLSSPATTESFAAGASADASAAADTVAPMMAARALAKVASEPAIARRRAEVAGFTEAAENPRSAFVPGFDPDGFERVSRAIESGIVPNAADVHIEDLLNHFAYDYGPPDEQMPLTTFVEVAAAPWNADHRLVRIGLRGQGTPGAASMDGPVARNTRVEVAFNPQRVKAYRLLGYEGENGGSGPEAGAVISAGQTFTALYEVLPVDATRSADELLNVSVDYLIPGSAEPQHLAVSLRDEGRAFYEATDDFRFAAAVAGFGMLLRDSPFKASTSFDQVIVWAQSAVQSAPLAFRDETTPSERRAFVELVRLARGGSNG